MNKKQAVAEQKLSWSMTPTPGHFVHFYKDRDSLIKPLSDYMSTGLTSDETCILIASERHVAEVTKRLLDADIDVDTAQQNGSFIVLDAATTLSTFMDGDSPDDKRFNDVIGSLIDQAVLTGKPIRAYGEMVALLWQEGNKSGVLKLESLWNELGSKQPFSLFCAYPELHFFMHGDVVQEISDCHDTHRHVVSQPAQFS